MNKIEGMHAGTQNKFIPQEIKVGTVLFLKTGNNIVKTVRRMTNDGKSIPSLDSIRIYRSR